MASGEVVAVRNKVSDIDPRRGLEGGGSKTLNGVPVWLCGMQDVLSLLDFLLRDVSLLVR